MERLTEDSVAGETYIKQCASSCPYDGDFCGTDECPVLNAVADKLGEYERAEKQGLLVRFPCKVGDIVWDIDAGYSEPCKIAAFSYSCHDLVKFGCDDKITFYYTSCRRQLAGIFLLSELGKTVFLTREEAEKKLEELRN